MGTELTYPKLPDGKPWNLKNKIRIRIGKWPGIHSSGPNTVLRFVEDLTGPEITQVNTLMASPSTAQDPYDPDITGNSFTLKDIYKHLDEFIANAGYPCELFYDDAAGTIKGQFTQMVPQGSKKNVTDAIADLFTWDV